MSFFKYREIVNEILQEQGLKTADGRLVHPAFCRARPSEFTAWFLYWFRAVPRPDKVGSSYNEDLGLTPESVFEAWRLGLPIEKVKTLGLPSRFKTMDFVFGYWKAITAWKRAAIAIGDTPTRYVPVGSLPKVSYPTRLVWCVLSLKARKKNNAQMGERMSIKQAMYSPEVLNGLKEYMAQHGWERKAIREFGIPQDILWNALHMMPEWAIIGDNGEGLPLFMKKEKFLHILNTKGMVKILNRLTKDLNLHDRIAVTNLVLVFGTRVNAVMRVLGKIGVSVHDMGINIDGPWSKEAVDWAYARRDSLDWGTVVKVCNRWEDIISRADPDNRGIKYLEGVLASLKYKYATIPALAAQAAMAGIEESHYYKIEKRYKEALSISDSDTSNIPHIGEIRHEGYVGYVLDKDDPRGLFLGNLTDCCQYPGGAGESCAWHGLENNRGGFFVVEYKGQVMAQSWVWRTKGGKTLCFDNIETLGTCHDEVAFHIYQEAAKRFVASPLGIERAVVGLGYNDMEQIESLPRVSKPAKSPKGVYTDADKQVMLACSDISRLPKADQISLLKFNPSLIDQCEIGKFEKFDWVCLVHSQPDLVAKYCDFKRLGINKNLLFSEEAKEVNWGSVCWGKLLSSKPQFAVFCDWDKLDGRDWAFFLAFQPQFAERCDWDKLKGEDWRTLLSNQPQFAERCDWGKLGGLEWSSLLSSQPQFAERCDWGKLDGMDWGYLLSNKPQFAERCDWEWLNGENWYRLLSSQPQFVGYCDWGKLDGEDWAIFLAQQPQFAEYCDWDKLRGMDWGYLLTDQPQFAERCDWGKLDGEDWSLLLIQQPQFVEHCDWGRLEERDWENLISNQPQFAEFCDIQTEESL